MSNAPEMLQKNPPKRSKNLDNIPQNDTSIHHLKQACVTGGWF